MSLKLFCRSLKSSLKKFCGKLGFNRKRYLETNDSFMLASESQISLDFDHRSNSLLSVISLNLLEDQSKIKDVDHEKSQEVCLSYGNNCSFIDLTAKFLALQIIRNEMKRLAALYEKEEPIFVSKVYPPLRPNKINKVAKISASDSLEPSEFIYQMPAKDAPRFLGDSKNGMSFLRPVHTLPHYFDLTPRPFNTMQSRTVENELKGLRSMNLVCVPKNHIDKVLPKILWYR